MEIKNNKGITLVALVITIVVLLILSAVVVGTFSQNSVIGKAKSAKEETKIGEEKELIELAKIEWGGGTPESGEIYFKDFILNKFADRATVKRISGGNLEIKFNDSGNIYTIKEEGVNVVASGKMYNDTVYWTLYDDGEWYFWGNSNRALDARNLLTTEQQLTVKTLVLDEGLTKIDTNGFSASGLTNLKNVYLPHSFVWGNVPWINSPNITDIYYNGTVQDWISVYGRCICGSGIWFKNENDEYTKMPDTVEIPSNITTISNYKFCGYTNITLIDMSNCDSLICGERALATSSTDITYIFGTSTTSFDSLCFDKTKNITLDFRNHTSTTIPTLHNNAWGTATIKKIIVPDALYDSWVAASGWSAKSDYIVKASEYVE